MERQCTLSRQRLLVFPLAVSWLALLQNLCDCQQHIPLCHGVTYEVYQSSKFPAIPSIIFNSRFEESLQSEPCRQGHESANSEGKPSATKLVKSFVDRDEIVRKLIKGNRWTEQNQRDYERALQEKQKTYECGLYDVIADKYKNLGACREFIEKGYEAYSNEGTLTHNYGYCMVIVQEAFEKLRHYKIPKGASQPKLLKKHFINEDFDEMTKKLDKAASQPKLLKKHFINEDFDEMTKKLDKAGRRDEKLKEIAEGSDYEYDNPEPTEINHLSLLAFDILLSEMIKSCEKHKVRAGPYKWIVTNKASLIDKFRSRSGSEGSRSGSEGKSCRATKRYADFKVISLSKKTHRKEQQIVWDRKKMDLFEWLVSEWMSAILAADDKCGVASRVEYSPEEELEHTQKLNSSFFQAFLVRILNTVSKIRTDLDITAAKEQLQRVVDATKECGLEWQHRAFAYLAYPPDEPTNTDMTKNTKDPDPDPARNRGRFETNRSKSSGRVM